MKFWTRWWIAALAKSPTDIRPSNPPLFWNSNPLNYWYSTKKEVRKWETNLIGKAKLKLNTCTDGSCRKKNLANRYILIGRKRKKKLFSKHFQNEKNLYEKKKKKNISTRECITLFHYENWKLISNREREMLRKEDWGKIIFRLTEQKTVANSSIS